MPLSIFYEVVMVLTQRDLELFRKLSSYGMLSTKQIAHHVFSSIAVTTVLRRLRILEESFYLKRILGLESQDVLWTLTEKAADTAHVIVPKRQWSKNMLEHDFKLLSLRLALEGTGIAHSWLPEHKIRSNIFRENGMRGIKQKLIPDGLMGIEVEGKRVSVAVELEITLKNKRKLKEIVDRYQRISGIYAVWYIAPSATILNAVADLWKKSYVYNSSVSFYGSLLQEVMRNPLKARLLGGELVQTIDDKWTLKPAHPYAQGVSTLREKQLDQKRNLTNENHAPIL